MALSDDGVYRWRVLMCSDQYIAGDTAWDAPTRLALNEWGYIYIPMSAFISGGNGFDKKCFVSVTFNKPQDGNADNAWILCQLYSVDEAAVVQCFNDHHIFVVNRDNNPHICVPADCNN